MSVINRATKHYAAQERLIISVNIMPNGTGATPVTVNMNIKTPDVQSFNQSKSQIAADMARTIERARRNL